MTFQIFHNKHFFPERPKVDVGEVTNMFKNDKLIGKAKVVTVKEEMRFIGNELLPVWTVYYKVVELIKEPV